MKFLIRARDEGIEEVAALLDANGLWRGDMGLDFVGIRAWSVAILERGESDAVHGDVDGRAVAVERLAQHEHGFAMRIPTGTEEGNVGGEGGIARDLFPGEVEVVDSEPHIFAAAGDGVGAFGGVVINGAGMDDGPDVLMIGEDAAGKRLGAGKYRNESQNSDDEKTGERPQCCSRHGAAIIAGGELIAAVRVAGPAAEH